MEMVSKKIACALMCEVRSNFQELTHKFPEIRVYSEHEYNFLDSKVVLEEIFNPVIL